jgi:hypothetical protein
MARGKHNSPQKTDFSKRRKSQLKAAKLIKQNDLVLKSLK